MAESEGRITDHQKRIQSRRHDRPEKKLGKGGGKHFDPDGMGGEKAKRINAEHERRG